MNSIFQFYCTRLQAWLSFESCLNYQAGKPSVEYDDWLECKNYHPCSDCPQGAGVKAFKDVDMSVLYIGDHHG